MTMRWYVVHTYSGFEKAVVRSLKEHIRNAGMEGKFGEILVPTEEVVEMKSGQKRTSERKFFPGYVLVKMEMDDETWHLVKDVPKVSGFIGGSGSKPTPISHSSSMIPTIRTVLPNIFVSFLCEMWGRFCLTRAMWRPVSS